MLRKERWLLYVCWVMLVSLMTSTVNTTGASQTNIKAAIPSQQKLHVVLIGASIGEDWKLQGLKERRNISDVDFEALQAWQFDKSDVLEETLMRPNRKFHLTRSYFTSLFEPAPVPADIIVLKECSSYFPGNFETDKEKVKDWVTQVRNKNIQPVLATAVPVTKARSERDPGKQEGLRKYNDWVREYAAKNKIVVLDLEMALRTDSKHRFLRDDLTSGDGSHLNHKAYEILDAVMIQTICRARGGNDCH